VSKILIVDDQFNDRELARDLLEDQGFNVETSGDAKEALQKLDNDRYDIVLTDLMMPEIDGLELIRTIKEKKYDTGIILMTAYATVETAIKSIKLGAYDYLIKPLDKYKIPVVINNCISAHKLSKEMKMLYQKMFNIEKMSTLSQLTASMAHQLRNPLFAIQSTAEYLSEKYKQDKTLQESLNLIINNSHQADKSIHNLLRTTKIDEIKLEKVPLNEIINRTLDLLRPEIDKKNVKLITELSNKIYVMVDASYLHQCLLNIIMNSMEAFESLQENKMIKIKTYIHCKYGCVEIEDTGKGIPEDIISKVKEPFFTMKPGGTGIGLFFVHQVIVNYFNGDVQLESAVGKGIKVTISLVLSTAP